MDRHPTYEHEIFDGTHTLVVATDWIVQPCSTPGCSVMIRSRVGMQAATLPVCKWCQSGTAHYRKAASVNHPHTGERMTLDEFGQDLFNAIVLRATSVMAENGASTMREKGLIGNAEEAERIATQADDALHALLDRGTIDAADVRRLLQIV